MSIVTKNRGWRDIIADILESTISGNAKTRIMTEVGLSYYQLNEYLDISMQHGLLLLDKKNKTYTTTEKGREFLRLYNLINNLTEHQTILVSK